MKTILLALLLVVPARAILFAPNNAASSAALKAALEAHMDGDDAKARRHLRACIKKATPNSPDLDGCHIYLEWWAKGVKQIDAPSKPEARRAYSIGVEAYKKGDLSLADAAWHECIDLSEVDTAVRNDCLAMIDLIPKRVLSPEERKVRDIFMEGFVAYSLLGDRVKARAKFTECLALAHEDDPTWADCRRFLDKLDADAKKH